MTLLADTSGKQVHEPVPLIEFRFTCPHCHEPWATVTDNTVDIHGGATYTCADCGGKVEFSVERVDSWGWWRD